MDHSEFFLVLVEVAVDPGPSLVYTGYGVRVHYKYDTNPSQGTRTKSHLLGNFAVPLLISGRPENSKVNPGTTERNPSSVSSPGPWSCNLLPII